MFAEKFLLSLLRKVLKSEPASEMHSSVIRKPIAESSIIVVGAIRNGADQIEAEINTLRQALRDFKKVSYLVVESDSTDDTVAVLEKLKTCVPDFDFTSLGELRSHMPSRTQRLAHCRNYYVDQVRHNSRYADIDYVAGADLDRTNTALSAEAVQTCWETNVPWDVVTANQAGLYYDIWSLRHPYWCPDDCWRQYSRLRELLGHEQAHDIAVLSKMAHLHRNAGFVEVEAAFGGFAIYKRDAFVSGRYAGLYEDGSEVCDNVPFHADLRQKGFRIFINAALINVEESEHTEPRRQLIGQRFLKRSEEQPAAGVSPN